MPIPSRPIAAALLAATPLLALAWMPEPPPAYGPPGYGYPGLPPAYGYPPMGPPGYPGAPPWAAGSEEPSPGPVGAPATTPEPQAPASVPETAAPAQGGRAEPGATVPDQAPPTEWPGGPGPQGMPYGGRYGSPSGPAYGSRWEGPRMMPGQLRITREVTDDAYLVHILVGEGKTEEVQVTPLGRSLAISRSTDAQTEEEQRFDDGRGYQRSYSFSRGAVSRRLGLPPDADLSGMTREAKDGTITLRIPRVAGRGWGPGYGPGQPGMPGERPQGATPGPFAAPTPEAPPAPAGQP
ncbi:MAG: Hsp20/alpha crystallin family protein [Bdellovibrio bacteriovorus]